MHHTGDDWLWRTFAAANKTTYEKKHWKASVSTLLWTIWLNRNDHIFNNNRATKKQMEFLITHRSFLWCTSSGIIPNSSEQEWTDNPIRTVKKVHMQILRDIKSLWDYYSFVDGSWNRTRDAIKTGIGGYIKHNKEDLQFIFSGPTAAEDPLQAETNAMVVVLNEIHSKISFDKRVIVHTDSFILCRNLQFYKAGIATIVPYAENLSRDLLQHVTKTHIKRLYNKGADYLAKQGVDKPTVLKGWV